MKASVCMGISLFFMTSHSKNNMSLQKPYFEDTSLLGCDTVLVGA
jgi:hypothetical protein